VGYEEQDQNLAVASKSQIQMGNAVSWPSVKRILIADDHDIVRRGIRAVVECRDDWKIVAEAMDGRSAFELALETKPNICILDYSLQGMNGLSLTRAIKRELPDTEILMFTMHDNDDLVRDILVAGARGFILKSDADRHLVAAIDAVSRHKPYFTGSVSETLLAKFLHDATGHSSQTLTDREREVVQLIAEGKINKEVSRILDISVKTVETHRASAMQKLNLKTAADLVRYAIRNNIVQP
jgi:DNA-binding NarL/FixJ family response regulator